jgi:hypothetical protein
MIETHMRTKMLRQAYFIKTKKNGALLTSTPKPKTPAVINKASETAQTEHKIKTCRFSNPALKIKAFWAPIATIKESPKPNPAKKVFIVKSETLPHH